MSPRVVVLGFLLSVASVLAAAPRTAAAQPGRSLPPEVAKLYEETPVIELVTMGVGGLIWERHGHIAICVTPEGLPTSLRQRRGGPRAGVCYNYGIADFGDPLAMAWGFFRGTNSFWAGTENPREMLARYQYADRSIWTQPLPLSPAEKQQVIAKLERDVLEENKYYSYDHFWDNCTTRIRDILDNATGGSLRAMQQPSDGRTYRDLAREGFYGIPNSRPALIITDTAMARVTDRVPSYYERMFLPDYMREAAEKRWGIAPIPLYLRQGPPPDTDGPSGRVLFALVILALTSPAWLTRLWGRFERTGLAIAVLPPVLLGVVLWGLALISPLPYVRWNETLLILLPLDLLLLLLPPRSRRLYARGRVIMLGLLAALMVVGVLTAPLFAHLLWPLIPAAVVAFWPRRDRAAEAVAPPSARAVKAAARSR